MTEIMLQDYARAHGLNSVSLRLFNVAGAHEDLGQEKDATHIIARIMESAMAGEQFTLNGDDFATADGTCVRDYVHVTDVASAVAQAVMHTGYRRGAEIFNVGNGAGYSNLDIVNAIKEFTPLDVKFNMGPRREGDPDKLVADMSATEKHLRWTPLKGLDDIVKTAYNYYNLKTKELSA